MEFSSSLLSIHSHSYLINLLYNPQTVKRTILSHCTCKLQFKGIARKGPKFRGGPTEPQMRWNFVLHSLRRLLFPLRPKLTRCARSDKGLRGNAMLAHEENSNASAYSVCPPRNFCFTDYSTIMNNAARTILTKVCKNRLFQISFWLCFVFWQSECLTVAIIFIGSTRDKKPRKHKVLV